MSEAERCHRCGGCNPSWSAPSPLWNAVMRGGSINGDPIFGDMVCVSCFIFLAEESGIASQWRLCAAVINVDLETITPSGRIWDQDKFLWIEKHKATAS